MLSWQAVGLTEGLIPLSACADIPLFKGDFLEKVSLYFVSRRFYASLEKGGARRAEGYSPVTVGENIVRPRLLSQPAAASSSERGANLASSLEVIPHGVGKCHRR